MKTERVRLPALLLGGVGFYGDPFQTRSGWDSENEIGHTCDRFTAFIVEHPQRPYSCGRDVMYEVHIYGKDTASKGQFEVFVGEEVNTAQLPVPLCSKYLPESDYLKVTLVGQEISGDWWQTLDTDRLAALHVKRGAPYIIQAYDHRFKGMDRIADSTLDAYIPVIPL